MLNDLHVPDDGPAARASAGAAARPRGLVARQALGHALGWPQSPVVVIVVSVVVGRPPAVVSYAVLFLV